MKVSIDTRTIQPGDIFIPIKGPNFDGHQFIEDAIRKGAQKILDVDIVKFASQYRKKLKCKVIGVTGSAGKTTVKDMLYYVLKEKYIVHRSQENQNNEIGVPLTILQADSDTEILITEMAMRQRGEIAFLSKIARPTHAVITNVGKTHIELLKTQRNIALSKAEIFRNPLQWEMSPRFAFLNYSSAYYELLSHQAKRHQFTVLPFEGQDKIEQNINLCYLVGRQFGLTNDEIKQGLSNYHPSSHRLDVIQLPHHTLIDDTYNANPDGVRYALDRIKRYSARKIFVFGDMLELGEHSAREHQKVIDYAIDSGVDILFTYGKETAIMKTDTIAHTHFHDKAALQEMLFAELKPGDVILVKGSRGMKMEEIVNAVRQKWS